MTTDGDREALAALLDRMLLDTSDSWSYVEGDPEYTTIDGVFNLHKWADAILAAGWRAPRQPAPDHEIDVIRVAGCTVCGRDVQWSDDTDQWEH